MVTRVFKVMGYDGHRQAASFGTTKTLDYQNIGEWSRPATMTVLCSDVTSANDCIIVVITADSEKAAFDELYGQLDDGLFEGCRYGDIYALTDIDEYGQQEFLKINKAGEGSPEGAESTHAAPAPIYTQGNFKSDNDIKLQAKRDLENRPEFESGDLSKLAGLYAEFYNNFLKTDLGNIDRQKYYWCACDSITDKMRDTAMENAGYLFESETGKAGYTKS